MLWLPTGQVAGSSGAELEFTISIDSGKSNENIDDQQTSFIMW
jgi:hypothetical protein